MHIHTANYPLCWTCQLFSNTERHMLMYQVGTVLRILYIFFKLKKKKKAMTLNVFCNQGEGQGEG